MTDGLRRAVAYVAGRIASARSASAVYDFGASQHFTFTGDASVANVNVYDHDRGCHVSGSPPSIL